MPVRVDGSKGKADCAPDFDWLAKAYDGRDIGLVSWYPPARIRSGTAYGRRFTELLTRLKLAS